MSALGKYIAQLREERGWSQRELARRTQNNYKQATISKLESGGIEDPGIGLLTDLAKALKVPVYTLILVYQKKDPNFKEAIDKDTLKKVLHKAIDKVIEEQF